jgi:hypothetical protein
MLDVDWHTEQSQLNATVPCYSYGGYTVNTALWPDWAAFIDALHTPAVSPLNPVGVPLKLMLNLHPQGGTDACQKNWSGFADAIDYAGTAIVPCTWGNQRIAAASFASFMDAVDLAPVDGWCECGMDGAVWLGCAAAVVIPTALHHTPNNAGPDFDFEGDCYDAPTAGVAGSSWPGIAWSNEVFGGACRVRILALPLALASADPGLRLTGHQRSARGRSQRAVLVAAVAAGYHAEWAGSGTPRRSGPGRPG